ncbi:hypothetical protein ZIOFF_025366 [Zingiber officinale]|uniref:Disease resistance protein winged helix domain-containing protein n=1 Tax=Zingiber officinale TaxID=94328 RepID=A0A8J5GUW8_ZINOF|nr:hypothetical protein ZIOFF_025366 [Zingiber officinale]
MLPPRLKRCFSYCCIFPQDYQFKKQQLVCMWVAAGLSYSEGSEEGSDEDIANRCFDTLCNKSFFNNWNMSWMKKILFYDTTEEIYTMHDMLNSLACHVSRYECCRIVHGTPSRILDSNAIRHISITCSTNAQLLDIAKMVCKLKHLRTLWRHAPHRSCMGCLSKDANKLTNLRHLYGVQEDALLSVAEVGKLTSLQELCFTVSTKPRYRIDELMNMDNLRELKIKKLSNVRSLEEANMVKLGQETSSHRVGAALDWSNLEELPPLWKLPCLKFLKLKYMEAIRSLGGHFSNWMDIQFPVLEELEFRDLPLLEEWNGADDYVWFPLLKSFRIEKCPRLKKILDLPLSIENLIIKDLGLEALPWFYKCSNGSRTFGGFQRLIFLKFLEIYKCPGIVQLGSIGEEDDNLLLSSLETLELENIDEHKDWASYLRGLTLLTKFHLHCSPGLESFPLASELEHLTVLQDLRISDGESLTSLGDLYILKSLKSLEIFDCPKFLVAESASNKAARILPSSLESLEFKNSDISQEPLGRCLQGLTSLERLIVSGCHHLVSLPNIECLHNLTALQTLDISDCKELCELESLTTIASLRYLRIERCPKLLATTFSALQNPSTATEHSATKKKKGTLPSLEEIDIDDIFYLPILPISEKLKTLSIKSSDKEFTCFPSEIEEWFIYSAPALKSLPRMPASLEQLTIFGCSEKLKKRCQENIGWDWPNIKHIPYIHIRAAKEDKAEVC